MFPERVIGKHMGTVADKLAAPRGKGESYSDVTVSASRKTNDPLQT
jgi:hypothetical protein